MEIVGKCTYVIRKKDRGWKKSCITGRKEEHERASRAAAAGNKRGSKNQRMHSVGCTRLRDWDREREKEKNERKKERTKQRKPWEIKEMERKKDVKKNKSTPGSLTRSPRRHLHYQCVAIKEMKGDEVARENGREHAVYTVYIFR